MMILNVPKPYSAAHDWLGVIEIKPLKKFDEEINYVPELGLDPLCNLYGSKGGIQSRAAQAIAVHLVQDQTNYIRRDETRIANPN